MAIELKENERLDDLQRNGLQIIQKTDGFCFGMDAVLLSGFAAVKPGERALDLGTGTGIIPLLLSAKTEGEHFSALEIQDEIAEMVEETKEMADTLDRIITDAGEILGSMADGDYTAKTKIEDEYVGQFVALKDAMRKMNRKMNATLKEVAEASGQVRAGSENLAESSQELAEGATEQAGAVEELTVFELSPLLEFLGKATSDFLTGQELFR